MSHPIAILYFTDGTEAKASVRSAFGIKNGLGDRAVLVALTKNDWVERLNSLALNTLCFLATHGGPGEDGTLQSYLEARSMPHTHSTATTSGVLANKHLAKLTYVSLRIPTPPWAFAGSAYGGKLAQHLLKKPRFGGSKQGIQRVEQISRDSRGIYEGIIPGNLEVAVPVVRKGREHFPLNPIVRERSTVKWGKLQNIHSTAVPVKTQRTCQKYAQKISEALDCYGVTKTDFAIDTSGNIWTLETDAIPGLGRTGATCEAAAMSGIAYEELLNAIKDTIWKPTN